MWSEGFQCLSFWKNNFGTTTTIKNNSVIYWNCSVRVSLFTFCYHFFCTLWWCPVHNYQKDNGKNSYRSIFALEVFRTIKIGVVVVFDIFGSKFWIWTCFAIDGILVSALVILVLADLVTSLFELIFELLFEEEKVDITGNELDMFWNTSNNIKNKTTVQDHLRT